MLYWDHLGFSNLLHVLLDLQKLLGYLFSRHHLILGSNLYLIFLNHLLIRTSKIKSLCLVTTLSPSTTLQSIQQPLSTFLIKKKSIWLALDPFLKVIKWDSLSLFLNQVFAKIKSYDKVRSRIELPGSFLSPKSDPPCTLSNS